MAFNFGGFVSTANTFFFFLRISTVGPKAFAPALEGLSAGPLQRVKKLCL